MRVMLVVVGLAACDRLYSASAHHDAALDLQEAGIPSPHCSPIGMLIGEFRAGTTFHTHWWDGVAVSPAIFQTPDTKSVTIAFGTPSTGGSAILTANAYLDLRDSAFTLSNTDSATFATDAVVKLALTDPSGMIGFTIQRVGPMIEFDLIRDGNLMSLARATYSALSDRYWRIHHAGNTVTWETSMNGDAFDVRAAQQVAPLAMVRPQISVDPGTSSLAPTVTIADINGGNSGGSACPVSQLADKFDLAAFSPQWVTRVSPVTANRVLDDSGGVLLHAPGVSLESESALVSATIYDLKEGSLAIQQTLRVSAQSTWVRFGAETLEGEVAELQQDAGGYSAIVGANQPLTPMTIPPPPWWRIREDHGLLWETSSDGASWFPYTNAPDITGMDQARIVIGIYQNPQATTGADGRFDNVNQ